MPKHIYILLLGLVLFSSHTLAQQKLVDSLHKELDLHQEADTARIRLLVQLAFAYRNTSPEECRRLAGEIKDLALRINYKRGVGISHQLKGVSYAIQGDFSEALNAFLMSLDVFKSTQDSASIGRSLSNIAGIYYNQNNFKQAEKYSRQALEIVINQGDPESIATTNQGLGVIQVKLGKYDEAERRYEVALDIFKKAGNAQRVAGVYQAMGTLFIDKNEPGRALNYLHQSLEVRKEIGDRVGTAAVLLALGELQADLNRYTAAEKSLDEAKLLAEDLRLSTILAGVYEEKTKIDEARGDYRSAYQNQGKWIIYKDSVYKKGVEQDLASMKLRHEVEENLKDNKLLKQQQELQDVKLSEREATIRSQQIVSGAAIVVAIILAIFIFILISSRKKIQESNTLLREEQREHIKKQKELEELSRTKDQWFAMVCHDFKQPFSFMQGALGLLNGGSLEPHEREMLLIEMEERVINNSLMLDNLLYWAQDQQHGIVIKREQLDIEHIINENIFLLDSVIRKKQVDIQNNIQSTSLVWADRNMMHLVVKNLLDNAIKISGLGGKIRINEETQDKSLVIHIGDSGQDIPKQYLEKLFDFDQRRVLEGITKERGIGLNLILAKDFIEKNEGEIWVRNVPGKGNVFSFSLPFAGKKNLTPKESVNWKEA